MKMIETDFQIYKLSDEFYRAYPRSMFPELMDSNDRRYNCLLVETHYGYYVCIPYRTEMNHRYGFHFTKSERSQEHKSGIDYTKMVLISDGRYLSDEYAVIDNDEYIETIENIAEIKEDAVRYLEEYISHVKGAKVMHPRKFERKYAFTTLKYFHDIMGVSP